MNKFHKESPSNLEEKIEGLGDPESEPENPDYPLNDILVRTQVRSVFELLRRIKNGYITNPDYQREFLWDERKQSKLIESCIMRIPLPVFYVAELQDGKIAIVDGVQRITTFMRFKDNKLKLKLGENHPLHGKQYENLTIEQKFRVDDTQLTFYILDKAAPARARLDIFERVNSGVPLTRQQMRNALFNGPATKLLARLAKDETFLIATGQSLHKKKMRDREAINRFYAFYLSGAENYTNSDMDEFLGNVLNYLNKLDSSNTEMLNKHENSFIRSMQLNYDVFGHHAFRKSLSIDVSNAARSVINISLFDVLSYAFAKLEVETIKKNSPAIRKHIVRLLENDEFTNSITYSTNSTKQVSKRFEFIEAFIEEFSE